MRAVFYENLNDRDLSQILTTARIARICGRIGRFGGRRQRG